MTNFVVTPSNVERFNRLYATAEYKMASKYRREREYGQYLMHYLTYDGSFDGGSLETRMERLNPMPENVYLYE